MRRTSMRGDVFLARLSLWRCPWHSIIAEALGARAHGEEIALTTDFDNKDRIVQLASQARSGQMDWVSGDVEWCGCVDCGLPVRTGRWQLLVEIVGTANIVPLVLIFDPFPYECGISLSLDQQRNIGMLQVPSRPWSPLDTWWPTPA